MSWRPTTDDELGPAVLRTADGVYESMVEFSAAQGEVSGYGEDEDVKTFSVAVVDGEAETVAIYVDWEKQTITTAWRVDP